MTMQPPLWQPQTEWIPPDEFPDLSKSNESQNYNVKNEIKLSNKNYPKLKHGKT